MRRDLLYVGITGLCAALAIVEMNTIHAQPEHQKLPGARAVVVASEFPSIQAALDSLPPDGGVVHLPPGRFVITEPLIVSTGDTHLTGAGNATHIVNLNEDGQAAVILQHADGSEVASADRLWRIMVSNLRLTGNPKSGAGIHAVQIQEVFIQGVTVSEHGGDGIWLEKCYEDPRVSDCLITYNGQTGLNLTGCHDIVVAASQFEENQDALHCFDGFNLCMTGNCLDDHLGHGVVIENTYGSVLSGNMIEECKETAVILDRDCYGITVSANVIAHNGAGVDLRDAHGCAVSANTLTILKRDAIRIGPDSGRITVTGNNISDSYIGEGAVRRKLTDRLAGGLVLEGTTDVAVSGNLFSSVLPKAIELRGEPSERLAVTGNVFTDVTSDLEKIQFIAGDSVVGENLESQ